MSNIGLVKLSPRQWPKDGRGAAKWQLKKRAIKQKEKQFIPHFKFIKQSIQFPALSLLRPRLRLLGAKELFFRKKILTKCCFVLKLIFLG